MLNDTSATASKDWDTPYLNYLYAPTVCSDGSGYDDYDTPTTTTFTTWRFKSDADVPLDSIGDV